MLVQMGSTRITSTREKMALIIYMEQVDIMAGRRWTEDEVDYILLAHNDNESTVEEVADFLGRTVSSVRCKSEIINKGKGQFTKRHWQDEEIRILQRYYQKVQDLSQLAKILDFLRNKNMIQ